MAALDEALDDPDSERRSELAPRPGQREHNPLSGETLTFRHTAAETAGRFIELDLELRPMGAPAGLPHRHLVVERFQFTAGLAAIVIGGQPPRLARPGDLVEVPAGRWHYVLALQPTHAEVRIEPGLRFDELLVAGTRAGRGRLSRESLRELPGLLRMHGCL